MNNEETRYYFVVFPRGNYQGLNVVYCTKDMLVAMTPASRIAFPSRELAESYALNMAAHEGLEFPLNLDEYNDYLD